MGGPDWQPEEKAPCTCSGLGGGCKHLVRLLGRAAISVINSIQCILKIRLINIELIGHENKKSQNTQIDDMNIPYVLISRFFLMS